MQVGSERKTSTPRRGRPREYDEAEVLDAVLGVFWRRGFSGATLPELSEAAGITRPSLYTALGDKLSMYLRSLEHFKGSLRAQLAASLDPSRSLSEGLTNFYTASIDLYLSGGRHPRGCLVFSTAPAESVEEPEIRASLLEALEILDEAFEKRFMVAIAASRAVGKPDQRQLAAMASAVMHSLAVRARAGEKRASLMAFALAATGMLVKIAGLD